MTSILQTFSNGLGISLVVFLPLVSAVVILFIPKKQEFLIKVTTLGSSIVTFLISLIVAFQFDYDKADIFQLGSKLTWIESINSNYEIGIDGISLPLLLLSTFISVLAIIYSFEHLPEPVNPKGMMSLILILETGMNGTFVALDLILFLSLIHI